MYNFNNMGPGMNMNYGYAQVKRPEPTNPLSNEDIALLRQKAPQFTLQVSQVDALKAICTHRDKNGDTLIPNNDGSVTCSICGTRFTPVNTSQENVEQVCKSAIDILETIKMMYVDIPNDVTKSYFQMTPFLAKAPQLYKIALDQFNKYNGSTLNTYNNYPGNAVALFGAMMPGMMIPPQYNPYQPQPGMAPQYAQPGMAQPVPDVTMGAANGVNPFDVSSPAAEAAKTTDNNKFAL